MNNEGYMLPHIISNLGKKNILIHFFNIQFTVSALSLDISHIQEL